MAHPGACGASRLEEAYEILGELGEGGFARVLAARRRSTGQRVALKLVRAADEAAARRELALCAALTHPNIVPLLDAGTTGDGDVFLAFALMPGRTLAEVLAAEGPLAIADAMHLMAQVLDALSAAHARGVVHRDLKPENILVAQSGVRRNALVLDFGLAGFTAAAGIPEGDAELIGSLRYAAPEQLRGEPPTPLADLYSWGLMLLECLTGVPAIPGASASEVFAAQVGPEPIAVPRWLRSHALGWVIERVTAKDAATRAVPLPQLFAMLSAATGGSAGAGEEPRLEPERRQVTVLCCRFPMSADGERVTDGEDADQRLQQAHARVTERAAAAGGVCVGAVGDRALFVFGYPHGAEDDARRAARLAVEVAAEAAVSVGLHSGMVTVPDARLWAGRPGAGLLGETPQRASALAERAAPGEVLVGDDTRHLLRGELACEPVARAGGEPAFRLSAHAPGAAPAASSSLVGRAAELQRLLDGWRQACAGRGSAAVLIGEAGIGKTRLLLELRRRATIADRLALECAQEARSTPLRPVLEALPTLGVPLESLLVDLGFDLGATLPLLIAMLSLPPDPRFGPPRLTPERQKALALDALVSLFCRLAERRPLLLTVENLHWADATTRELATQLVRALATPDPQRPAPRLFIVCTTRPEGLPDWSGGRVTLLPLPRLQSAEVERMVADHAGTQELPPRLLDQVLQRAEGVPLFVEEITRVLVDGGGSRRPSALPSSLRELLTARLDGVSAVARETAQLAAVLGREFGGDLLEAVSPKDRALLRRDMDELRRAGLVLNRPGRVDEAYMFRHALVRDAVYESMTRAARRRLHQSVLGTIQQRFPALERARPEIAALHAEEGGDCGRAVDYWCRAGGDSFQRAAYTESLQQLEHARELVATLEPTAENQRREMMLLIALGSALLATRGWAAPEVEATFGRAWTLSEMIGGEPPIMVLYGVWGVRITRSDRAAVEAMLPVLHDLAATTTNRSLAAFVEWCLCCAAYWRGEFAAVHQFLDLARFGHARAGDRQLPARLSSGWNLETGDDGSLYSWMFAASTLWATGYAERAQALRGEALALAGERGGPLSLALVLGFGSMLANDCGDLHTARAWGERLMALADEQRLIAWWAPGACAVGRTQVLEGRDGGVALIRQGLERYRSLGVMCSYNYYLTYLVEAYLHTGAVEAGLATVEEGLRLCRTLVARFHEPELLRLRAGLRQRRGELDAVEPDLHAAIAMAERDGARAYALRAALDLARLLAARGRRAEGASRLAAIYEQFNEGFATADLRAAASFLAG